MPRVQKKKKIKNVDMNGEMMQNMKYDRIAIQFTSNSILYFVPD